MNSAASATRSQTESKKAPRGPARPLWRATEPSRMSGRPVRTTPKTPSRRWPSAMSNAVPMAKTNPMTVRPSAVIPARYRPWPTGSSPRSTVARQRPSSMRRKSSVGNGCRERVPLQVNTHSSFPRDGAPPPGSRTPGCRLRGFALRGSRTPGSAAPGGAPTGLRRLRKKPASFGGCRWRRRRSRRRRSATWPWSATAARARPPSPRRCSSPPGRSPASGRVEDGTTTTRLRPRGGAAAASRCRWPWPRSSTTATRST